MDRLGTMAMLVTVTEKGSLSAAARALQIPLATLSRRISDLERLLGARLLIRSTRKLTLTDAGAAYVDAARRILEQVDEAERNAAGEFVTPKGELVLTAPVMFGRLHLLPLVVGFLTAFPAIDIRLILVDRNVDLIGDHVDMALRIGRLPDSGMVATPIGMMRTVTCASPGLLDKHGHPETPDDLPAFPCVSVEMPMLAPSWRYHRPPAGTPFEVPVRPRLTVTATDAAAQAVILDMGIVRLLHYQVADALQDGRLRIVLEAYEPEPIPVHLLHASRGQMPLKMRHFLDYAAPRLTATLARIGQIRGPAT